MPRGEGRLRDSFFSRFAILLTSHSFGWMISPCTCRQMPRETIGHAILCTRTYMDFRKARLPQEASLCLKKPAIWSRLQPRQLVNLLNLSGQPRSCAGARYSLCCADGA